MGSDRFTLGDWKSVSDIAAAWISIVGLIIGGLYAVFQYLENKGDARIERSLDFVKRFNDSPLSVVRNKVDAEWDRANPQIRRILITVQVDAGQVERQYHTAVLHLVEGRKLGESLVAMMNFLEQVAVCGESNLCDVATLRAFFERHGRIFFRRFYPYICRLRSMWNDPTIGLRHRATITSHYAE